MYERQITKINEQKTRSKVSAFSFAMKSFLLTFVFLQVVLLPAVAIAATCLPPQIPSPETGDCYTPVSGVAGGTRATYTLMAPLTGLLGPGSSLNLTKYLEGIVQVTIGIAGILAVIMMVYCGLKLMGTPSASGKSEAKECIANAIFGVLLALSAWILLNTINPLLLSNELRLGDVQVSSATTPNIVDDPYPTAPGWYFQVQETNRKKYISAGPPNTGMDTCTKISAKATNVTKDCFLVDTAQISTNEAGKRVALCGQADYDKNKCVNSAKASDNKVGINKLPCPTPTATGCTNVGGLQPDTVNFLTSLDDACHCDVTVTGGSEQGIHSGGGHPSGTMVDVRSTVQLSTYIVQNGTGLRSAWGSGEKGGMRVYINGWWFVDERGVGGQPHWHACKDNAYTSWYCTDYTTKEKTTRAPPTQALLPAGSLKI